MSTESPERPRSYLIPTFPALASVSSRGRNRQSTSGSDGPFGNANNSVRSVGSTSHRTKYLSRYYQADDLLQTPRLVQRNQPYHQSRNLLQMEMKDLSKHTFHLLVDDWFHVFLRFNTFTSLGLMLGTWTLSIISFAAIYRVVDGSYAGTDCGLVSAESETATLSYGAYFAFSLETCTTVGYGLPGSTNAFFDNCPVIQMVIYFQMMWSMMFNAFLFAFFFARLAKTESRGSQVIFSSSAIVSQKDDGKWAFQIRVTDVDAKYPVVEAHVRLYAKVGPNLLPMRVLCPNDDLGANLFLSWPNTICHEIDRFSPLHPQPSQRCRLPDGELNLREADIVSGYAENIVCPVCSEGFTSMHRLRKHVAYYKMVEEQEDYPIAQSHRCIEDSELTTPRQPTQPELQATFPEEVIVMVEGIDPLASGTFQALQSYTMDDMQWGGLKFDDCLVFTKEKTVVDLNKFHHVIQDSDLESSESESGRQKEASAASDGD